MNLQELNQLTDKELERFRILCNHLLSKTFVLRTVYKQGKGRVNNPDYTFLVAHFELFRDYLSLLDWDLLRDDYNGYCYVQNTDEANRHTLNKVSTAILLALRLLYDENQEQVGLEHDVICAVHDVLEIIVTEHPILSAKPNMDEVKRTLTYLENHCIVERLDGRFHQATCRFAILPTILTVVPGDRLNLIVTALKKEESQNEEPEEDSAD